MNKTIKVTAIQQAAGDDTEAAIKKAAADGAQLIVLQELFATPYFCQTETLTHFDLAETIPGPTTNRLAKIAKQLNLVIVTPLFEKRASGIYHNSVAVIEHDGEIAGVYRKMHIPDDPGFHEKFYFTPGDQGFQPIDTSLGKLGILICWDQWFPEAARIMSLAGAELLIYPTAIGWDPRDDDQEQLRQIQAWKIIQQSHAIANALPVIVCNRVGFEADPSEQTAGIQFWGNSFITGTQGELLAQGSSDQADIISTEIDLTACEKTRRIWPFLRDRRIDAYQDILKRYHS